MVNLSGYSKTLFVYKDILGSCFSEAAVIVNTFQEDDHSNDKGEEESEEQW